jgi:hypothetical protein
MQRGWTTDQVNYYRSGMGQEGEDGLDSAAIALQQNWSTGMTISVHSIQDDV